MKIDLHGVKHENVSRYLDIFFWEMLQKKVTQVEVIENPINVGMLLVKLI